MNRFRTASAFPAPPSPSVLTGSLPEERLPFSVRVVRDSADLYKAVRIRHSAYARHLPAFADGLRAPEPLDTAPGVTVLLAESRLDGSPLGTVRIQTNVHGPLAVEQSIALPPWMEGLHLAEVTRLAIAEGRIGRLVKLVLIKACFQYCEREGIDYAVAAGRAPLDRQYAQLMFDDLFPQTGFIPLRHAGNLPHRIMAFDVATGEERWARAQHPLLHFFRRTRHPDIELDAAEVSPAAAVSAARLRALQQTSEAAARI